MRRIYVIFRYIGTYKYEWTEKLTVEILSEDSRLHALK